MSETSPAEQEPIKQESAIVQESAIQEVGPLSKRLTQDGFTHESLGVDHLGVEILKVDRAVLIPFSTALYAYGFNYLQCQAGYDAGPGQDLVSMYHLVKVDNNVTQPEEVRVKVFLPRENPVVPSVYWIWKPTICTASFTTVTPTSNDCSCRKIGWAGLYAKTTSVQIFTSCKKPIKVYSDYHS
jgi:hypothetical protein